MMLLKKSEVTSEPVRRRPTVTLWLESLMGAHWACTASAPPSMDSPVVLRQTLITLPVGSLVRAGAFPLTVLSRTGAGIAVSTIR